MSIKPITTLADMQNLKVWVPDGDRLSYGAVEALGISPVTMPLTDVLTGLQTELIDTIISPPSGAIVLQWNTAVSYITELPLAYIVAMLVIEKRVFDRLQAGDQAIVREVMEGVYKGFDKQGYEDNEQALQALLDDGMKSVAPDNGQVGTWRSAVWESNHKLAAEGAIDVSLLNEIECHINAYREGNLEKACTQ
jgi:TRAP-type C4-dicarboxylate transport system substrate-binding protein